MPKISIQYEPVKRAMITAAQIRAARGLLNLSQAQLAEMAELGIATIKRIEASSEVRGAASTLWKIQAALEKAGDLSPSHSISVGWICACRTQA